MNHFSLFCVSCFVKPLLFVILCYSLSRVVVNGPLSVILCLLLSRIVVNGPLSVILCLLFCRVVVYEQLSVILCYSLSRVVVYGPLSVILCCLFCRDVVYFQHFAIRINASMSTSCYIRQWRTGVTFHSRNWYIQFCSLWCKSLLLSLISIMN